MTTVRIHRAELVSHRPGPGTPAPRTLLFGFDRDRPGDGLVAVADLREWDGRLATIPWTTDDVQGWRFSSVERTATTLHFSRPDRDTPLALTL